VLVYMQQHHLKHTNLLVLQMPTLRFHVVFFLSYVLFVRSPQQTARTLRFLPCGAIAACSVEHVLSVW
jgi:hypothetical protein